MTNSYHAIDPTNPSVTPEIVDNFYQYMTHNNRSVFFVPEADSELIADYGLSRADIKLLYEAHLTYLGVSQLHSTRAASMQLTCETLSELVAEEFTPRVITMKQQNSYTVEFEYSTPSNTKKIAVYTITMPKGVGFELHCHTYKPGARHSFKDERSVYLGLGKRLMTETKPKRLGGNSTLSRYDVYALIKADAKKRKAQLHFQQETESEAELKVPYTTTLLQRRVITMLDNLDFPEVGEKLADVFADNELVSEETILKAVINKKVDDRYQLLDATTFNVLGYLEKNASREQLAIASTVCVTKGKTCFKLAERM